MVNLIGEKVENTRFGNSVEAKHANFGLAGHLAAESLEEITWPCSGARRCSSVRIDHRGRQSAQAASLRLSLMASRRSRRKAARSSSTRAWVSASIVVAGVILDVATFLQLSRFLGRLGLDVLTKLVLGRWRLMIRCRIARRRGIAGGSLSDRGLPSIAADPGRCRARRRGCR